MTVEALLSTLARHDAQREHSATALTGGRDSELAE
jgi:hypothetical protein